MVPPPAEAPSAAPVAAIPPVAPPGSGIAALRTLLAAPGPSASPAATQHAPPVGGFPLIDAALAVRPLTPPEGGPTLAALRDRLAATSQPMGH